MRKNHDSQPRLVPYSKVIKVFPLSKIHLDFNLIQRFYCTLSYVSITDSACVTRISVRVRGGDGQAPTSGLDGLKLGLIRDMGSAFFESQCELNDKTSSPFSSNRTMFETEEVRLLVDTR